MISKLDRLSIHGPKSEIPGAIVPLGFSRKVWKFGVLNCSLINLKIPLLTSDILINPRAELHPTEIFPTFGFSLSPASACPCFSLPFSLIFLHPLFPALLSSPGIPFQVENPPKFPVQGWIWCFGFCWDHPGVEFPDPSSYSSRSSGIKQEIGS